MLRKIIVSLSVIALVVILFFVNFTTPTEIGPFGVLIFFLAVYLFVLGLSLVLISLLRAILKGKKRNKKLDYAYAVVFAFGPIMILLMRAFEILSWWTIIVPIIFVLLGCFLVKKRFGVVK